MVTVKSNICVLSRCVPIMINSVQNNFIIPKGNNKNWELLLKILSIAKALSKSEFYYYVDNNLYKSFKLRSYYDHRTLIDKLEPPSTYHKPVRIQSKSVPHIDILVDNTANFALFSFMDGFSGYNQIKMAPEDMWGDNGLTTCDVSSVVKWRLSQRYHAIM